MNTLLELRKKDKMDPIEAFTILVTVVLVDVVSKYNTLYCSYVVKHYRRELG